MATFKPIAINKTGVTLAYKEGQYIVATQPFTDGVRTYAAGVYVDMLGARQQLTMQGPQGDRGEQGIQGPQGEQGEKGDTGATGPKGDKGDTGATGPQGEKGDTGATGATGAQGEPGKDGVSPTVEVVHVDTLPAGDNATVENVGTEQDVRLVFGIPQGAQGPKGDKGDQGEQGIQGIQGPQGDEGRQGAQGIQGPQGIRGEQGPAGEDGRSFQIVAHVDSAAELPAASALYLGKAYSVGTALPNDVYICMEQDGVLQWYNEGPIQGPKGDKGEQGIQGPQGEQGIQGQQGIQGEQGAQGATGPAGPQGEKGDTGPQGPAGPQGPEGPEGPKGKDGNLSYATYISDRRSEPEMYFSFLTSKIYNSPEAFMESLTLNARYPCSGYFVLQSKLYIITGFRKYSNDQMQLDIVMTGQTTSGFPIPGKATIIVSNTQSKIGSSSYMI